MIIYIDANYICHSAPDVSLRAFDVSFFDGKCEEFINGYRYVPQNESWINSDGIVFDGEMIAPIKNYFPLASAQTQYETDQQELDSILTQIENALGGNGT